MKLTNILASLTLIWGALSLLSNPNSDIIRIILLVVRFLALIRNKEEHY